jgi:hypothetical protein
MSSNHARAPEFPHGSRRWLMYRHIRVRSFVDLGMTRNWNRSPLFGERAVTARRRLALPRSHAYGDDFRPNDVCDPHTGLRRHVTLD